MWILVQSRRCPRNGKQVKEQHDATVHQAWEGAAPGCCSPLASPETGLKGLQWHPGGWCRGAQAICSSRLAAIPPRALRCVPLLRGCARRKKPMVLHRLPESRGDPRFEPPKSTAPSDANRAGNGGANARGGQAGKLLRPLDRALTVIAIIGLSAAAADRRSPTTGGRSRSCTRR